MNRTKLALSALLLLGLVGCGNRPGERALTGGAIGAGGGALLGAAVGGSPLTGAVLGGLGGAVIGAVTTPTAPAARPGRRRGQYRY